MEKIFGYDFADIQRAQAGGRLESRTYTPSPLPTADARDIELLKEYGEEELRNRGLHGILDRLKNSGLIAA
jgi:hypothetical protein